MRMIGAVRFVLACVLWITAFLGTTAPAATAPGAAPRMGPPRTFVQIKDDLWRAGNGNWWSLIYVTPDGILLVDPISTDFATWVKSQLATRFPGKPVRYIIYSHSHWDHVGGAAVFADSHPHIVGQERILKNMDGRFPHMPGNMIDLNHNGNIDSEEIAIPTLEHPGICGMGRGYFESIDHDHTGSLTPAQWWAVQAVVPPDIVYSDRMTLIFGGRRIELVFPGLNHADDGTVVYFPAERVVFSTDFPADALVSTSMRSLPSGCGMFDHHPLAEWIKSYRAIESLDFDILAQGHGAVTFTKADVTEGRQYFEDLRAGVQQGMAQGKSLAELKKTLLLEKYKDWAYYDMLREVDIEAAYLNLENYP
ncbi:MAG TPA: MBL fold metallo-hydrolase [Steroidobacteraceae bacterium]|nr:MBL fold metallo-hydrolase [Steroidobacteraceae bacterium]